MFSRIEILMTNTSTPYHRAGMMNESRHGYAMHDKRIYQTNTRCPKDHPFHINNALSTMFMQLLIIVGRKKYINPTWFACSYYHGTQHMQIRNEVQTFTLHYDFDDKKKRMQGISNRGDP